MSLPSEPVGFKMQTLENYTLPPAIDNRWYKSQFTLLQDHQTQLLSQINSLDARIKDITKVLQENFKMEQKEIESYIQERNISKISKERLLNEIKLIEISQETLLSKWQKEISAEMQRKGIARQDHREFFLDLKNSQTAKSELLSQIEDLDDLNAILKNREEIQKLNQHIQHLSSALSKIESYLALDNTSQLLDILPKPIPQISLEVIREKEIKVGANIDRVAVEVLRAEFSDVNHVLKVKVKTHLICQFEAVARSGCFTGLPPRVTLEIVAIQIHPPTTKVPQELELSFCINRNDWQMGSGNFSIDIVIDTPEQKNKIIKTIH